MPLTLILILVTCGVSIAGFNSPDLMSRWIMSPYAVKHQNQWYRFITSGFLHANWMHLFFNMFVLYSFGQILNNYFIELFGEAKGNYYFIVLYIGGLIVSDLSTYVKYHNSPSYSSLGASGAVSSVLFAFILLNPINKILIYFIPVPGVIAGVGYLVYSWYMSKRGGDHINHDAHFYGALYGFVFPIILRPSLIIDFIDKIQYGLSTL